MNCCSSLLNLGLTMTRSIIPLFVNQKEAFLEINISFPRVYASPIKDSFS